MAIAFVNTANGRNVGGSSVSSAAFVASAGNLIVVFIGIYDQVWPTITISDTAGNTYAVAVKRNGNASAGTDSSVAIYYAKNCKGNAANVVTVSYSYAPVTSAQVIVAQYSGVDTLSPLDVTASSGCGASTNTAPTSGSFTPAAANELVVSCLGCQGSEGAVTYSAGYVSRASPGGDFFAEDDTTGASGSQSSSYTISADYWSVASAVFKAAAGTDPKLQGFRCETPLESGKDWGPWYMWGFHRWLTPILPPAPVGDRWPLLPQSFMRPVWRPPPSFATPTSPFPGQVIVPQDPIPPTLPVRFARPAWDPEKSYRARNTAPVVPPDYTLTLSGPSSGLIGRTYRFTLTLTITRGQPKVVRTVTPFTSPDDNDPVSFGTVDILGVQALPSSVTTSMNLGVLRVPIGQSVSWVFDTIAFAAGSYQIGAYLALFDGTELPSNLVSFSAASIG